MINRRKFLETAGAAALVPALSAYLPQTAWRNNKNNAHRILSCNIRVALDEDEPKGYGWSARKDICLKIIKDKRPDIVALQEVLKVQADDLRNFFSAYQLFGFEGPEMDPHPTGYYGIAKNPILFSAKRYELLTGGTYWLSETPLVAGSKSWDTARARHANWIRIRERCTGKEFRVVNLHLDHVSETAKIRQAEMVAQESAQYMPDFPQLLAGDFNSKFNSNVMDAIRNSNWKDSYETIHGATEAGFTTHEFKGERYEKGASKGRIDFIWYKGRAQPTGAAIVRDSVNGKYPSDHFFMQADLIIE
ncbi:MAG: endonuclease/exonuclease/phosphatase family protein [Niabella sp.]